VPSVVAFLWWKTNALQGVCAEFLGVDKDTFIKWRDMMEVAVSNLPVVSKASVFDTVQRTALQIID
jgi:hypothetical protein